ncbi:MAG: hypothetical protein DMF81_07045, partial [Acidobacteria bacterium]
GPGESALAEFEPGPGFQWYDTFLHVLRLHSSRGAALPGGDRGVGAFVHIDLEVNRRNHS